MFRDAIIWENWWWLINQPDTRTGLSSERAHPLHLQKKERRYLVSCLFGNILICISFTSINVLNRKVQTLGVWDKKNKINLKIIQLASYNRIHTWYGRCERPEAKLALLCSSFLEHLLCTSCCARNSTYRFRFNINTIPRGLLSNSVFILDAEMGITPVT